MRICSAEFSMITLKPEAKCLHLRRASADSEEWMVVSHPPRHIDDMGPVVARKAPLLLTQIVRANADASSSTAAVAPIATTTASRRRVPDLANTNASTHKLIPTANAIKPFSGSREPDPANGEHGGHEINALPTREEETKEEAAGHTEERGIHQWMAKRRLNTVRRSIRLPDGDPR